LSARATVKGNKYKHKGDQRQNMDDSKHNAVHHQSQEQGIKSYQPQKRNDIIKRVNKKQFNRHTIARQLEKSPENAKVQK